MRRALVLSITLTSLAGIALWLGLALLRAGHPFELEWQEGGMLAHVARLHGRGVLYAAPALEFTAFPYPPLYPALAGLFGDGFVALRAVSIASTLVLLLALFRLAGGGAGGCAAAGIVAVGHAWAGSWLDVGRNDALFLALIVVACLTARGSSARRAALGGVLAGLAFFVKQSALPISGLVAVGLFAADRRRGVRSRTGVAFAVGLSGALALGWALGHALWGEWWRFYLLDVLRGHPLYRPGLTGFWLRDLPWLLPGGAALLLGARGLDRPQLGLLMGCLVAAWLGRAHVGGYDNVLLPALVACGLGAGQALNHVTARGEGRLPVCVAALVLVQLVLLGYDPRAELPSADDVARGEALVAELAAVDGAVLVPAHPYLAGRAGKDESLHWMALLDLNATGDGAHGARLVEALRARLAAGRYAAVVLDGLPELAGVRAFFEEHLREVRPVDGPAPVTGARAIPSAWLAPR